MRTREVAGSKSIMKQRRTRRELAHARATGLPTIVMLLSLAASAGHSPRSSIGFVARLIHVRGPIGVVAHDFAAVHARLELGASLESAILGEGRTTAPAPEIVRVLDLLRRAETDGGSLQLQFEFLLRDLRRQRANALDEAAQRLTVWMLFPLVLCILPAFILLAVVPLLIEALSGLPG